MGKEEKDDNLNFKTWIFRTVVIGIILLIIVYLLERYLGIPILTHSMIAISITIIIGLSHEACHYITAIKLGYKPKWYRTKVMMGFEIIPHSNKKKWRADNRKISLAPYVVLIPLSIIILIIGYIFWHMGLIVSGVSGLLLHAMSIRKEGIIV